MPDQNCLLLAEFQSSRILEAGNCKRQEPKSAGGLPQKTYGNRSICSARAYILCQGSWLSYGVSEHRRSLPWAACGCHVATLAEGRFPKVAANGGCLDMARKNILFPYWRRRKVVNPVRIQCFVCCGRVYMRPCSPAAGESMRRLRRWKGRGLPFCWFRAMPPFAPLRSSWGV